MKLGIDAAKKAGGVCEAVVCYSGDVASLLYDARQPDTDRQRELARTLLKDIGLDDSWLFTVGG